jgi:hypothetical protein
VAERKSFLIRVDPALWSEIERWAANELRSVNGQVEFILREAVKRRGVTLTESDPTSINDASKKSKKADRDRGVAVVPQASV